MKFGATKPPNQPLRMKTIISEQVIKILDKVPLAKNLARKKFISSFVLGLIESRKVQFQEVALHMESKSKVESAQRRIQAFFKDYTFDYQQVCLLLTLFLPRGKVCLSIDRTEWDFGSYQCNILMIVAYHTLEKKAEKKSSVGIPLYWLLLDNKSGNSNVMDRCALVERLLRVIGKQRVGLLVADREFIGHKWVKYLKDNQIPFCIRLPKTHLITLKNGDSYRIEQLVKSGQTRYFQDCLIEGIVCHSMIKGLENGDFLFLIGTLPAKQLGELYRKRWCIEVLFQSFKQRGFDLESTHLKSSEKLSKLLVFVSLAVAICVKMGEYAHGKVEKIRVKKHGYKQHSFFRKGLDLLRVGLKRLNPDFIHFFSECIQTFLKWIQIQFTYYQSFTNFLG